MIYRAMAEGFTTAAGLAKYLKGVRNETITSS